MRYNRWRELLSAAILGMLVLAGSAAAKDSYLPTFRAAYPAAVGSRIDSCLVCHTTTNASPSTRNVYGAAFGNANHSYTAIASADADQDGFANGAEIAAFFFPGNSTDHPVAATLPTVTIAAADATATEAGPTTGQYTLTRSGATTAALTVNYTVGGTATATSDYLALPGSVVIAAGSPTATVTVTPIDDATVEAGETVIVTVGASAGYTVGTAASATVTIQSDDLTLPTVTIAATDPTATEVGTTTGQFTLTRTGAATAALAVAYTVAGTAAAGSDYLALTGSVQIPAGAAAATVTVTPINDTAAEIDETVVATLSANAAYAVGTAASATVTIQSDEITTLPTVTIAATDATATEAGTTTGQYTLTRTGATTAALTVNYTVAGTATAGSDYTALSGSVQIPAGATTATVTVTPINDATIEADETVIATLGASAAYAVGAAAGATITILSEDVAAAILTVASTNPSSGVSIAVTPSDSSNMGGGSTQFTRTYDSGVLVKLKASSTFGGPRFTGWSGCDSVSKAICLVTMDGSRSVTANYSASTAYVLWTRGDVGKASLWKVDPGLAAGSPPVIPRERSAALSSTAGVGAGWLATSYQHVGPEEGYVLWTRRNTGKAMLWKIDPSSAAGSPAVIPVASSSDLRLAAGGGGGWQATSYQHVGPDEGYVLWTRRNTGQAVLWKVDPNLDAGSPAGISRVSASSLYSAAGVGGPWEATSYQHVSATEGYVLWTRSDTGQAALWKINPGAGTRIIPVSEYLYSSPVSGGPWKATDYLHVSATEGYLLWTRTDTGQAEVWKIDPGASVEAPPMETAFLSSSSGIGGPWQATGYAPGGVNGAIVADSAMAADVQAGVDVLKSGNGAGTIEFGSVTCGPACDAATIPYAAREDVVVTAAEGSWFTGWETADGVAIDILQAQPGEKVHAVFERQ